MSTGKFVSALILPWSLAVAVLFLDRMRDPSQLGIRDDAQVYTTALDSLASGGRMIIVAESGPMVSPGADPNVLRSVRTRLPLYFVPRSVVEPKLGKSHHDSDYWTRFNNAFAVRTDGMKCPRSTTEIAIMLCSPMATLAVGSAGMGVEFN